MEYAAICAPVTSFQLWNRCSRWARYSPAGRLCRLRRKCPRSGSKADRKRWACPADPETPQLPLLLPRRLVRILRPVVPALVRSMLDPRSYFALGRPVALELVGDHHARPVAAAPQPLAEEALRGVLVPRGSNPDIEDVALRVHRSPQVTARAVDFKEDLLPVPLISRRRPTTASLVGITLAERAAPRTNRFVGDGAAAGGQEFFDSAVAERETAIKPDGG